MIQPDIERYNRALKWLRVAVEAEQSRGTLEASPPDLLIGVNTANVGTAALVALLVAKGVISRDEYYSLLADLVEHECFLYALRLGIAPTDLKPSG